MAGSRRVLALVCWLFLAACAAQPTASESVQPSETPASLGATPTAAENGIVGVWTRTQDCEGQLAAFRAAGLANSHLNWVLGNWFPEGWEPNPDNLCDGARPAEEHSHFFTAGGEFGSYDARGKQVDEGDYVLVDDDTVSFPSHAAEFGYDGDVLVNFAVDGDTATFTVAMPDHCLDSCADAYAWALSAFYQGDPWERQSQT